MSTESERKQILSMIASGNITPSQGVKLLQALDDSIGESESVEQKAGEEVIQVEPPIDQNQVLADIPVPQPAEGDQSAPAEIPTEANADSSSSTAEEASLPPKPVEVPDFQSWRRWMMIPLWSGVVVTILGGILMYITWMATRSPSFWFACAWVPFLIGIGLIALAWGGRSIRWLHIRIQQRAGEWPRNLAFSIPLPLNWLAWIVRIFGDRIPNVKGKDMDQMILALQNTSPEAPFSLDVDEGENGERVQIFIG